MAEPFQPERVRAESLRVVGWNALAVITDAVVADVRFMMIATIIIAPPDLKWELSTNAAG